MKKLVTFVMAAVLCVSMGMTALAAPSSENVVTVDDSKTVLTDKDGNKVKVQVSYGQMTEDKAAEAKKEAEKISGDVLANLDVTIDEEAKAVLAAGGSIELTFNVPGVKAADTIKVLHFTGEKWEVLEAKAGEGTVTAKFTSLSPISIVKVAAANTGNGTAPKTGDFGFAGILSVIAVCGAGLVLVNKKKAA